MAVLDRRARPSRAGRVAVAALVTVVALAVPASASAAPFKAVLHAPNHSPKANTKWKITVDVSRGTTKLSGSVRYEFLFGGVVVSRQAGHRFTNGVYSDGLVFPTSAVGMKLTLRTIVKTKYGTVTLPWTVMTQK